jgi:hypothetical protein
MYQLLVWPLSSQIKFVFISQQSDLATITCCDTIEIHLMHHDQSHVLLPAVTGCALDSLKKMLQSLAVGQQDTVRFQDVVLFGKDRFGNVLVDIRQNHQPFCYGVVTVDVIESWAAQLDLLQVVMEENENEKKSRGTGCCGM